MAQTAGKRETVVDRALCLNCGLLLRHQRDARIVMGFRPGIADSPDYVVAVDGVEVHRCRGPISTSRLTAQARRTSP